MDYLVFGVGFGSTLVLLGWVLRQFGPSLRYRDTPEEVLGAEQLLERNDWQRFCIAMGALLSVCGAVMLLVTLITLLIRPADRTGTIIVGSIFVISLLAVAAWIVLYVNQHRALAGDRRAEAVAVTRGKAAARPRPAPESAGDDVPAAAAPARATASASQQAQVSADNTGRRRESAPAPQAQRTTPAPTVTAPSPESNPVQRSATRPDDRTPPAQDSGTVAVESPQTTEPALRTASRTTTPAPEPAQVLRNLHFKRAGTARREEAVTSAEATQRETAPEQTDADAGKEAPKAPDADS